MLSSDVYIYYIFYSWYSDSLEFSLRCDRKNGSICLDSFPDGCLIVTTLCVKLRYLPLSD